MRILLKLLGVGILGLVIVAIGGAAGTLYLLHRYGAELPDYRQLADYQPPTVTRLHAGDGTLMAEFAHEKRVFVPVEAIPQRLVQAFLAAEDKNFYSHPGIDPLSILRAVVTNLERLSTNRRPVGASTITQQVAKNFLLSNEVTIERKIKEAFLAFRIERAFSKDQILELYLNQIYLGVGSYGVAAAALNYFDKSLDELTIAEAAYLAGLPKAPSRYHPVRQPEAAIARRDWVIGRMLDVGFITRDDALQATAQPLVMNRRAPTEIATAEYFAEEVRRELIERHGEAFLYQGGLSIRSTVLPKLQEIADRALQAGLIGYDRRHGWRGPETRLEIDQAWPERLAAVDRSQGIDPWELALVLEAGEESAALGFAGGREASLPLAEVKWARPVSETGDLGPTVRAVSDVLAAGDVIWVEEIEVDADAGPAADASETARRYTLRQPPEVEGAIVALDPHNGRVLAMRGGFNYARSVFNRATQALRQPGSALKPFVYLAALDNGFSPSSILLDAPIVVDQGAGLGKWKPANYSKRFYGPSTLRLGIEKSRNVMTVRLAQSLGMGEIVEMATRFDLENGLGYNLASALGSNEVGLLRLTTAYAMLVNGGKRIEPALIERIQDRHGKTIMRRDDRRCAGCENATWDGRVVPVLGDDRDQVIPPPLAYQMVSLLKGVVDRGTGRRARSIGKPIAGKTGTTDDSRDAWFVGFTPDLAVGVYVGFDQPKSLGRDEQGASAALPIFVDFMTDALEDQPATPFRVPAGVRLVRVDAVTGMLPGPDTEVVILEAFLPGTEPKRSGSGGTAATWPGSPLDSASSSPRSGERAAPQSGGLY